MPVLALFLLACTAPTPEPTPDLPATVSALVEVRLTEMPTGIPRSTNTPYPTYTPFPTPTKAPTPAPSPTATSTPIPTAYFDTHPDTNTQTLGDTQAHSHANAAAHTNPYPQSEPNPAAHGDAVTHSDTHRQTNGHTYRCAANFNSGNPGAHYTDNTTMAARHPEHEMVVEGLSRPLRPNPTAGLGRRRPLRCGAGHYRRTALRGYHRHRQPGSSLGVALGTGCHHGKRAREPYTGCGR